MHPIYAESNNPVSLSARLREGTAQSHTQAENSAYMKCFLKGVVEREPFRKLLANLYQVYRCLETALEQQQQHPILGRIYYPELFRTAALQQDLAYFYGQDWAAQIPTLPTGKVYVERLKSLATQAPQLLVAHAYTRYMGDLSGGQSLKPIIRSALNLVGTEGTAMYEFSDIPTPAARRKFKETYRQALDSLTLTESEISAIVAEANLAFTLNQNLLHDLEPDLVTILGEHTFDLLTRQDRPGSTIPHQSGQHNDPQVFLLA